MTLANLLNDFLIIFNDRNEPFDNLNRHDLGVALTHLEEWIQMGTYSIEDKQTLLNHINSLPVELK